MDIKACAAVREAVGPDIDLMIDGYHWYSRAEALWIGKELEKLNFARFEEPMEEDSMSSYAWLAENLSIPIVGPESFGGKHHMRAEWVKAGACDILRAGANGVGDYTDHEGGGAGGIFRHGLRSPRQRSGKPAVVGAIRNCRWYERGLLHPFLDYDEPAAYLNSIVDPMDDQGFVHLSQRPGLGEDINFAYIEANTVSHD